MPTPNYSISEILVCLRLQVRAWTRYILPDALEGLHLCWFSVHHYCCICFHNNCVCIWLFGEIYKVQTLMKVESISY